MQRRSRLAYLSTDVAESLTLMNLSVRVYESLGELHAVRPAWDQLLSRYPLATTFCTWEWLSCWWECFAQHHKLLTIALFDSKSLVGLAPLSISEEKVGCFTLRIVRLMGDGSGDSDNLDLPVQSGYERAFAEQIFIVLKDRKKRWDTCEFNTLPPDSLVVKCLRESLRARSWTFFEYYSMCSAIDLPENWELYTPRLSSEDRKNLTRYTRRLQNRHSVRIYRCARLEELPRCLEAFFGLHQQRWENTGERGTFSSDNRKKFYDRLSRCLLDRGWLEFWILELDGEIVAAQFGFRYRDKVFQLQEGYDHRRGSDRPGYVLRGAVLERLIQENIRTYDFLGGEDPYKARWGARQATYSQLHFAPALSFGAFWLESAHKAGRSKERLRNVLPSSVWSLFRKVKALMTTK
jgi:CelD/BcsL family acetyltransferase involved in cellulose biosynthesis